MYLAENLALVKKKWGYGQKKMGEIFGVNGNKFGSYERGEAKPSVEFLILVEEKTGISFRQFVTTMLKPEELPNTPLSSSEFDAIAMHWKGNYTKRENIREVSVEQIENMQAQILELIEWKRAEQSKK